MSSPSSPFMYSKAVRRRGLIILLVDTFLMWGGFFMVIPLISVHYVDTLGWTAASIGLVLAVRQLVQQGLAPIGGMLADRLGAKRLICTGFLLRAFSFTSLAWAHTFPLLLLSALLTACGGAFFESPEAAAGAALTEETNRNRFYALTGVISSVGIAIGTQVGALLLTADFALVALGAAGCFLVAFMVTLLFLPPIQLQLSAKSHRLTDGIGLALRDRPFIVFNILLIGYWFLWVQFSISLPLAAKAIGGTASAVSWIYALNSGMNVLLGYPLLRLAERWLRPLSLLIVGVILMALGLGAILLVSSFPAFLLCVALISGGTLLAMPSQKTVAASFAKAAWLGSYFGVNALAMALGGALGNYSGGLLYDLGRQMNAPGLPWTVFCTVGLTSAMGLWLLSRYALRGGFSGSVASNP